MAQWLRLHDAHAGGVDLIPGWGAHVLCGVVKKKKIIVPQSEFRLLLCKGSRWGPLQPVAEGDPYWSLADSRIHARPYYNVKRAGKPAAPLHSLFAFG